jgi:transcriptional regulator with XRE-family HTH domain
LPDAEGSSTHEHVTPDAIKALRKELSCTARELAAALDLDQLTVLAWERGELFPTKGNVDAMHALAAKGPGAVPRKAKGVDPMKVLADPGLWEIVRKLTVHKKLRDDTAKLAASYDDPAGD